MSSYRLASGPFPGSRFSFGKPWAATCLGAALLFPLWAPAEVIPGEGPALGDYPERTKQEQIVGGELSLREIRKAGLKIFATPFNHYDGYGDGPVNHSDPTSPGGRPMLGDNGTMLRVNGLDTQTCFECHTLVSADTVPATLGVGGAGGISTTALFQPTYFDVDADGHEDGHENAGKERKAYAAFDGRAINPLALFGAGGVQLLAKEMTADLQALKAEAVATPGKEVRLVTKGVDFGTIVAYQSDRVNTDRVVGVDSDLVVRPFGRKGEFSSLRAFDLEATRFHMGMEPVEGLASEGSRCVENNDGAGVDGDGDGVADELLVGEISALEIFIATMDRPVREKMDRAAKRGFKRFEEIGCVECHRPRMETAGRVLKLGCPEVPDDPEANIFYSVDLGKKPTDFDGIKGGGLAIELFSDLKRHDMGPYLAESFRGADETRNREFITAKLWGVADTAPYLHDGRALTLVEAILWHDGEAQEQREAFEALPEDAQADLIAFLRTLRNPRSPNRDVVKTK
jgi:hypothetical protein